MPNYLNKTELQALVRQSQAAGQPLPDLLVAARLIMSGLAQRYRPADLDDLQQDFAIRIIEILPQLDSSKNVFSYLTTVALNLIRHHQQGVNTRARRCRLATDAALEELHRRDAARSRK